MKRAAPHLILLLLIGAACQAPAAAPALTEPASPSVPPTAIPPSTSTHIPPTATATLAPAPRLFTEEFEGDAPYWIFMQTGGAQTALETRIERGALRLTLAAANRWAYAVYDTQDYADVRIDAQLELDPGGGAMGVICRYDPEAGWYEFNVYPDHTYTLLFGQWLTDGVARYTPLVIAESQAITPSVNQIGLACEGDILTPYINGIQMRRRQEKQHVLTDGLVGLSAASFQVAPVVLSYDRISVGKP